MSPTKIYLRDNRDILHHVLSVPLFAMAHQLSVEKLRAVINGRSESYRGWTLAGEESEGETDRDNAA